jgi:hypothetical protein
MVRKSRNRLNSPRGGLGILRLFLRIRLTTSLTHTPRKNVIYNMQATVHSSTRERQVRVEIPTYSREYERVHEVERRLTKCKSLRNTTAVQMVIMPNRGARLLNAKISPRISPMKPPNEERSWMSKGRERN